MIGNLWVKSRYGEENVGGVVSGEVSRARGWWERRDLNSHAEALDPKSSVSTNSTTFPDSYLITLLMVNSKQKKLRTP